MFLYIIIFIQLIAINSLETTPSTIMLCDSNTLNNSISADKLLCNYIDVLQQQLQQVEMRLTSLEQLKQTSDQVQKILIDIIDRQNRQDKINKFMLNNKFIHFKAFTDKNNNQKALIFPIQSTTVTIDKAIELCKQFNATLPEIDSIEQQFIIKDFLLDIYKLYFTYWTGGLRDSTGKWKWMYSGNEITYTNWASGYPTNGVNKNHIRIHIYNADSPDNNEIAKWENCDDSETNYVICELDFNL